MVSGSDALDVRHQPLLNGFPDRCYYPRKLEDGLLAESRGSWWATPAERPKLPPMRDGWTKADADLYAYLAGSFGRAIT